MFTRRQSGNGREAFLLPKAVVAHSRIAVPPMFIRAPRLQDTLVMQPVS